MPTMTRNPKRKRPVSRYVRARLTPEIFEALCNLKKQEPTGTDEVHLVTKLAHLGAGVVLSSAWEGKG